MLSVYAIALFTDMLSGRAIACACGLPPAEAFAYWTFCRSLQRWSRETVWS